MSATTSTAMLKPPLATAAPASAFFAFEKQATSLSDLEIVRKIVEREGCLEALEQLLRAKPTKTAQSASEIEIEQVYPYTYPHRGIRAGAATTATASPMVVQSLLDQLRSVSVQIIEAIEQWRASTQTQVFQWRQTNYLLKMTRDLDFLSSMPVRVDALQQLRLERNPFLSPLHLDHPALREKVPDAAVLLGLSVGSVDMRRVFFASKVLLQELEMERKQQQLAQAQRDLGSSGDASNGVERMVAVVDPSVVSASKQQAQQEGTPQRVRWSNQDVRLGQPRSSAFGKPMLLPLTDSSELPVRDRADEMQRDLELSRELILHAEHELGAIREEVALLQQKLAEALGRPDKRRKLQIKIGALVNTLKFRSGDLYQRKNELQRKEAVYRVACDRDRGASRKLGRSTGRLEGANGATTDYDSAEVVEPGRPESQPHPYLRAVDSAMRADELRRQEIVEKFMTLAKMRASATAALSSTSRHKHKQQQQRARLTAATNRSSGSSRPSGRETRAQLPSSLREMTPDDVAVFVDALDLDSSYGAKLRSRGIDGALLLQATDRDLEDLGVALRLHRVRILDVVAHTNRGSDQ